MNLTTDQKNKLIKFYPELRAYFELDEVKKTIKTVNDAVKGDKGEQGERGLQGVRGIQGEKGNCGESGKNGLDGKKGNAGIDGIDGINGKDGSPDTAEAIALKLNKLTEAVDVSVIKNAVSKSELDRHSKNVENDMIRMDGRIKSSDQRWHGAGLSKVSTDSTLTGSGTPSSPLSVVSGGSSGWQNPISGIVNGVNTTFVWAKAPNVIAVDYGNIIEKVDYNGLGTGSTNWTGTTTTILSVAPNQNIYAIA